VQNEGVNSNEVMHKNYAIIAHGHVVACNKYTSPTTTNIESNLQFQNRPLGQSSSSFCLIWGGTSEPSSKLDLGNIISVGGGAFPT
jgi:hypothetical protein